MKSLMKQKVFFLLLAASAVYLCGADRPKAVRKDWPFYGGDPGNTKSSPLNQINKSNVEKLQIAWTWKNSEKPMPEKGLSPGRMEATPIMIDDVLYVSTGYHRVIAVDANTGRELWSHDPHTYDMGPGRLTFTHRGV